MKINKFFLLNCTFSPMRKYIVNSFLAAAFQNLQFCLNYQATTWGDLSFPESDLAVPMIGLAAMEETFLAEITQGEMLHLTLYV